MIGPAAAQTTKCSQADQDCDGIPDQTEHDLLARFTPYFRFSRDNGDNETFRPADVGAYLSTAEVDRSGSEGKNVVVKRNGLADPGQLLKLNDNGVSSSLLVNLSLSDYHVNPDNKAGRRGASWEQVLASGHTGLYGHVVPIYLKKAEDYDAGHLTSASDTDGLLFYKIEYWQFFGYSSNNKPLDVGDHEGDWDTVQIIYQPPGTFQVFLKGPPIVPGGPPTLVPRTIVRPGAIKSVLFYAHGKEMRFDMSAVMGSPVPMNNGTVMEFHGTNEQQPVPNLFDGAFTSEKARNHILSMFRDPSTGQFDHPVVFVEHGGHEFWPSPAWEFFGAQKHGGDDTKDSYLATTPPNLGEVEHPLDEDPAAGAVVQFNGYWGTYSRTFPGHENNPPPGPPLHSEWTYPVDEMHRPGHLEN